MEMGGRNKFINKKISSASRRPIKTLLLKGFYLAPLVDELRSFNHEMARYQESLGAVERMIPFVP